MSTSQAKGTDRFVKRFNFVNDRSLLYQRRNRNLHSLKPDSSQVSDGCSLYGQLGELTCVEAMLKECLSKFRNEFRAAPKTKQGLLKAAASNLTAIDGTSTNQFRALALVQ